MSRPRLPFINSLLDSGARREASLDATHLSDAGTPHDAGHDAATPHDAGHDAATPHDAGHDSAPPCDDPDLLPNGDFAAGNQTPWNGYQANIQIASSVDAAGLPDGSGGFVAVVTPAIDGGSFFSINEYQGIDTDASVGTSFVASMWAAAGNASSVGKSVVLEVRQNGADCNGTTAALFPMFEHIEVTCQVTSAAPSFTVYAGEYGDSNADSFYATDFSFSQVCP